MLIKAENWDCVLVQYRILLIQIVLGFLIHIYHYYFGTIKDQDQRECKMKVDSS